MTETPNRKGRREDREDVDARDSTRPGLAGAFETLLRRTRSVLHGILLIPVYLVVGSCIGIGILPGIMLFQALSQWTAHSHWVLRDLALGVSIGMGYFLYGFLMIAILPVINIAVLGGNRLKAWRGPYYSLPAVRWYLHNALVYVLRYSFLEAVCPGPFLNFFYSAMGMKIGKGTLINTTHISDPCLIELGEKVTIGGSATIVAHYGVGGYLVIAPVKIGKGATVGLKATVMGGVEIGEGARILPNSVLLPKMKVPPGETWGGVPAHKMELKSHETERV